MNIIISFVCFVFAIFLQIKQDYTDPVFPLVMCMIFMLIDFTNKMENK